jgi:hypothetical protein
MATTPSAAFRSSVPRHCEVAENDIAVEYRALDESLPKSWCVSRGGVVLFMDPRLDEVLDAARMFIADGCAAWLISSDSIPIKIAPSSANPQRQSAPSGRGTGA